MFHSLGKVTITSGAIPVVATTNETDPTKRYGCQTMFFQQIQTNTGKLYICDRSTASRTTGVGVLAVIPAPTLSGGVASILPYAAFTVPSAAAALNAVEFWVAADNDGEACQICAGKN